MTMNTWRKRRKNRKTKSLTVRKKNTMMSSHMSKKTTIKKYKFSIQSTRKIACPHKSNCHFHIIILAKSSP